MGFNLKFAQDNPPPGEEPQTDWLAVIVTIAVLVGFAAVTSSAWWPYVERWL